jgi:serine phosphatase RsbU (regulator of sigma subunit)
LKRFTHAPARDIITGIVGEVQAFSAGAPPADDLTILALRYTG